MKYIESEWKSYRLEVVHKDATPLQVSETRRAFYAGAQAFFRTMMRMLDPGTEPTDGDMERMAAIDRELKDFCRDVEEGRA